MSANTYEVILDHLREGVALLKPDGTITYWNKGAERITGYPAPEVIGRHCSDDVLVHLSPEGMPLCGTGLCPRQQVLDAAEPLDRAGTYYLRHKHGHRVPVSTQVIPVKGEDGTIESIVEVFSDEPTGTLARQEMAMLHELALLDPLTGVGNRRYVETQIRARLDEFQRYGWPFGVLFVDVDNLKDINDQYGHAAGDLVLRALASTMAHAVRSFDTVGRWAGDEFIAVLTNISDKELKAVTDKMRRLARQTTVVADGRSITASISIGAAPASLDDSVETIVSRADRLMYQAKTAGGDQAWSSDGPIQ